MDLVDSIYKVSKLFPNEELYSLTNQKRREEKRREEKSGNFCSFEHCRRSSKRF
jgi:hypothetical protein